MADAETRQTKQGKKKLRAEQFNRACELMRHLDKFIAHFEGEARPRLHVNQASDAIRNWLEREYNLGMALQRRLQKRARHGR